jgi:hypothetical protein
MSSAPRVREAGCSCIVGRCAAASRHATRFGRRPQATDEATCQRFSLRQQAATFDLDGMPYYPGIGGGKRPTKPNQFLRAIAVALTTGVICQDWLAAASVVLLYLIWRWLVPTDGPPILALALSFQWLQVTAGIFYAGVTGRRLEAIESSDYRTMVIIGLVCVFALLIGLKGGLWFWRATPEVNRGESYSIRTKPLFVVYIASVALNGTLQEYAWLVPGLTQGILAVGFFRYGLLFLLLRRFVRPPEQWNLLGGILAGELVLGASGFFAGFREPLMIGLLVLLERFDRRRLAHWLRLGGLAATIFGAGLVWTGVKNEYRRNFENDQFATSRRARLERLGALSRERFGATWDDLLLDVDALVARVWTIYYPALAIERVPAVLPHTGGSILVGAVRHVLMPRLFFPGKGELPSDSEMVRQYSGIWVAGSETGTSIAFGYAAESYIDFGIPVMFLPILGFGLFMGAAHRFLLRRIHNPELGAALAAVIFWLSLYQFERSWVRILGQSLTLMIFLGGGGYVLDRALEARAGGRVRRRRPLPGAAVETGLGVASTAGAATPLPRPSAPRP